MRYMADLLGGGTGTPPAAPLTMLNDRLAAISSGREKAFPLYCVLLYTRDRGIDGALHRYVRDKWYDLDSLTGENCLMFAVAAIGLPGQDAARPRDVHALARGLGVPVDQLPCAVFFDAPDASRASKVVPFRSFLPVRSRYRHDDFLRAFRAFAGTADRLAKRRRGRLRALPRTLAAARATAFPEEPPRDQTWLRAATAAGVTVLAATADVVQLSGTVAA